MEVDKINAAIKALPNTDQVSDGYHTFGELYEHRILLFIALAKCHSGQVWKFKSNADGQKWEGWFGLGIFPEPGKQITYHVPVSYWDAVDCPAYEINPHYDGHTSEDIINRLKNL